MKKIPVYYFRHDFTAQDDIKILEMRMVLGWEGYGIFWALIECLAQQGGTFELDRIEQLAFRLRVDKALLSRVIHDFELFEVSDDTFTNKRLSDFLEFDMNKRNKYKNNALMRLRKKEETESAPKQEAPTIQGTTPEQPTSKPARKPKTKTERPSVSFPFDSVEFHSAWSRWVEYRNEIKKPYKSAVSEQTALNQLSKFNETFAIHLIEKSIANGWQGLVFTETTKDFEEFTTPKAPTTTRRNVQAERNTFNGLTAN